MIYETQRVAAKKRHLFKCEWTGSSSDLSQPRTASIWMRTWRNTWHQSVEPPGGHYGHWIIACVEPFWGPAAVVYFGLTCSVAARGRWQTFCLFLFLLSLLLLSCCCQSARRGETRWRHAHGPKWRQQLLLLCGFFFLELLGTAGCCRKQVDCETQREGNKMNKEQSKSWVEF